MGTFHAICARILRRESDHLTYYSRDFAIFDTADQLQVVKQALADLDLDDKKFAPGKMLNGISNAKNELITPAEYAASNYISEINRRVYERYQAILQTNNAMDFDDLLMNTVLLFDERAGHRTVSTSSAITTSWSTSSRTPTPRSTPCLAVWWATKTASLSSATRTSRSTSGAGPTIATSSASAKPSRPPK